MDLLFRRSTMPLSTLSDMYSAASSMINLSMDLSDSVTMLLEMLNDSTVNKARNGRYSGLKGLGQSESVSMYA